MATRALPGSTIGSSADKKASRDGTGIQGVFFDLGGTLYSYEGRSADHQRLLEQAVRQMGLKLTVEEIGDAHSRASLKVAHAYADKEYYLHAELFRDMFIQFCTEAGGEFDFALWQSYQPGYDAAVLEALKLRADCRSTLVELRERGYYTAIASNIDQQMLDALVEREALHELFDDWTSSEEAQSCKPHGLFFDCTQDKSGLDVGDILFVGDSPEHDIQGGYSAGMRTALIVEPGVQPPLQTGKEQIAADFEISALADLLDILD